MWECPNCHEHIEYLKYEIPQIEYGTASLIDHMIDRNTSRVNQYDMDDSSSTGPATYKCPECDEEINEADLTYVGPIENEREGNNRNRQTWRPGGGVVSISVPEESPSIEGPLNSETKKRVEPGNAINNEFISRAEEVLGMLRKANEAAVAPKASHIDYEME